MVFDNERRWDIHTLHCLSHYHTTHSRQEKLLVRQVVSVIEGKKHDGSDTRSWKQMTSLIITESKPIEFSCKVKYNEYKDIPLNTLDESSIAAMSICIVSTAAAPLSFPSVLTPE